jgi:hypothetical protein
MVTYAEDQEIKLSVIYEHVSKVSDYNEADRMITAHSPEIQEAYMATDHLAHMANSLSIFLFHAKELLKFYKTL